MTPSPNYPAPMRIPKGRVKSYTPPIVPGHHHHQGYNSSKPSSAVAVEREKPKEIDYFAGAKFDCLPSVSSLPTPPPEWTIPVLRSQSQPSSPVTTTTVGVRIDVNSLFLTPQQVIKSASFPKLESSGITSNSIMMNKKRAEVSNFSKNVALDKKYQQQQQQQMSKKRDNHYQKEDKKSSYSILTKNNSSDDYKSFSAVTSPKLTSTEQSKPLDITATHLGAPNQRKQMYPHLTEHLRGLLKVQG
jgi:hypothetical protein